MTQVGSLTSGAAWSTIKVPLAIAALTTDTEDLVERAITESDNDAARALWESLGPPAAAAAAVERVLASAGDADTRVETEVVLPPYTSFGQTEWTLAAQQRFAAGLSGAPGAEPVLDLMRRVIPEQRWGFAAVDSGRRDQGRLGARSSGPRARPPVRDLHGRWEHGHGRDRQRARGRRLRDGRREPDEDRGVGQPRVSRRALITASP